jgi:hypothetical protein
MHYRSETHAMPLPRRPQKSWFRHPGVKAACRNALALAAIAVAIALLVVKNRDRNPSAKLLKVSAIFDWSGQAKGNP